MNAKRKGNAFERECAAILRAELWPECYTSRFMGSAWLDYCGVDLTGTENFYIQCKAVQKLSPGYHYILNKKMPQQDGKTNLILHKKDNEGIIVAMKLSDFINMIKDLKR